jgi:hypothetical protein
LILFPERLPMRNDARSASEAALNASANTGGPVLPLLAPAYAIQQRTTS